MQEEQEQMLHVLYASVRKAHPAGRGEVEEGEAGEEEEPELMA